MAGFAVGMTAELHNLRYRERQLARGRRLLAAQARGVRKQLIDYYRLRGSSVELPTFPELTPVDYEEQES